MHRKNGSSAHPASTNSALRHLLWVLLALAGVIAVVGVLFRAFLPSSLSSVEASRPVTQSAEFVAFAPTIPNTVAVPTPPPEGMTWIPGGEFSMGAMDPPATDQVAMHGADDARPIHRVYVDGFWMDKTDNRLYGLDLKIGWRDPPDALGRKQWNSEILFLDRVRNLL